MFPQLKCTLCQDTKFQIKMYQVIPMNITMFAPELSEYHLSTSRPAQQGCLEFRTGKWYAALQDGRWTHLYNPASPRRNRMIPFDRHELKAGGRVCIKPLFYRNRRHMACDIRRIDAAFRCYIRQYIVLYPAAAPVEFDTR